MLYLIYNKIMLLFNNIWFIKYEKFMEKNLDKPWNWNDVSKNPNITMKFIEKNPDKPWNWNGVSFNPNITMEFIEKNPDKPWDWHGVSSNPNITMEIIDKHCFTNNGKNPNNPEGLTLSRPWNWNGVSFNSNLTMEFIKLHPERNWDWYYISQNPGITLEDISENINNPQTVSQDQTSYSFSQTKNEANASNSTK